MRSIITLVFALTFMSQVFAQQMELQYFAKVPSKYIEPGLSPLQGLKFGYQYFPQDLWVKDAGEIKLDLLKIRLLKYGAIILSGGTFGGYKTQQRDPVYKISEKAEYYLLVPTFSVGISYGFLFPWFINARAGVMKPWEYAYTETTITNSSSIPTVSEIRQEKSGEIQKFMAIEVYRPLRGRYKDFHPIGLSLSYVVILDPITVKPKDTFNVGIYWHIKH